MYNSSNFTSDLINSYAWDTAIFFIQTCEDEDYSRQNRLQNTSTLAKCGEATDGTNRDVRCNIYDMAGNTREWSTETSSYPSNPCVMRGGYYSSNEDHYTSERDCMSTTYNPKHISCRLILYW